MSEPRDLVAVTDAARMLAEAVSVDDIKKVVNLAEAARLYAKKVHLGLDAQNSAATIRIEAEAKLGALLTAMATNGQRQTPATSVRMDLLPDREEVQEAPPTLDDIGIDYHESSRYQAVAAIPPKVRAAYITGASSREEEITRAGLTRFADGEHVSSNSGEIEWFTPPEYTDAARAVMGGIDLDPASTNSANESIKAATFYTSRDDGLSKEWKGRVWMNPPYKHPAIWKFCERLAEQVAEGNVEQACVMVNNATETAWFQRMAEVASAVCFPTGRVRFWYPGRESTTPLQGQAVLYFGENVGAFQSEFLRFGFVVTL